MTIDKQALREAAEKATRGPWEMEQENIWFTDTDGYVKHLIYVQQGDDVDDKQDHYNTAFIAAFNPKVALALLDELKTKEEQRANWFQMAQKLGEDLDAAEKRNAEQREYYEGVIADGSKRIAELERANAAQDDHINQQQVRIDALEETNHELGKAARVNSYWKPDVCPVTGRQFFMWIEHETLGYVPTYGGPFDSYTIPTRDSSGEFSCERYDHDFGGWVGGEFIGLYLIDDDEQCRVCELEERIAELEDAQCQHESDTLMLCHQFDELASAMGWTSELAMKQGVGQLEYARSIKARIAELEAKLETADKLQDSAFRDGLKAGFSYGQTDDQSGFAQCMSAYSTRAGIGVKQQEDSVDSDVGRNQPGMVVAVHIGAGDFVKVKGQVFEVEETDFDDHDVTLWFVGGNALKCAAGCPVEVVSAPVAAGIKVKGESDG